MSPPLPRRRSSHQITKNKATPPPIRPRRPVSAHEKSASSSAKYAKLLYCGFKELVTTEAKYVEKMESLVQIMKSFSAALPQEEGNPKTSNSLSCANALRHIFLNLETLVGSITFCCQDCRKSP